jgi:hypothetical protein
VVNSLKIQVNRHSHVLSADTENLGKSEKLSNSFYKAGSSQH